MSVRRKKRNSQLKGIDEINMTPLIDLTFLLLIVFMITMPLVEYSTDVAVPKMNAEELPREDAKFFSLKTGGRVSLDSIDYSIEEYTQLLQSLYAENPEYKIMIRPDGRCSVEELTEVLRAARGTGFRQVGMVTAAE